MSSHESYFAALKATSGADQFIIINDDASSSTPTKEMSMQQDQNRNSNPSVGPPSCPLRKPSTEDLMHRKLSYKERDHDRIPLSETLSRFYSDVSPTIKPRRNRRKRGSLVLDTNEKISIKASPSTKNNLDAMP